MQRLTSVAVLLFVFATAATAAPQSPTPDSPVWRWFQDCSDKEMMGIEVTVDGKSVFKSSFPICKTTNVSVDDRDHKQKIVAFTFKGGHKFQDEYQTSDGEMVEGNIWQAGADPDDLILGVSFVSNKQNQILLNTLKIAQPDRRSTGEVDSGIFVETYPVRPN
jgi:hypothetical protein